MIKLPKLIALLLFFSFSAQADWTKVPSKEFELEDYPAEGSAEFKRDFAELLKLQEERDPKDCALATRQKHPDFKILFSDADLISKDEMETVKPLMNKVSKLADRIASYHKQQFKRPRPFNTNDKIEPCADKPTGALSYPSSHAAISALDACVLAKIFPSRAKKIREYGKYLGDLRAIVGVHHPSDVEAGQSLAADICTHLLEDEEFLAELKEVKDEL